MACGSRVGVSSGHRSVAGVVDDSGHLVVLVFPRAMNI